jgi:hypothetical protein
MSLRSTILVATVAVLFVCSSVVSAAERWPGTRVGQGPAEDRIFAALQEPTDLDFNETQLTDVISYLADFHKIPIIIDERSLSVQNVKVDKPVTIHFSKVSLRSALALLLKSIDLDYVVRDEVLIITTPDVATSSAPVCMFDVSPLSQNAGDMDELLSVIQSNASQYQTQITVYHRVLLVKGNQRQQDEVAEFLATLYQMQTQEQPQAATSP